MSKVVVTGTNGIRRIPTEREVDISNVCDLRSTIDSLLNSSPINYDTVIDFSNTVYIDSSVLELIIYTRSKLDKIGKRLGIIVRRKSQPEHVLRMCQFDTILDIWNSDELPDKLAGTP